MMLGAETGYATDTADITVDGTGGGVTLLAANANRKGAVIGNTGGANMRVTTDGTAPTTTKGIQLSAGDRLVLSMPYCPQAAVLGIRESGASTTASVEEII